MLNASFQYLKLEQYDGLFLTGGRAPEYLRLNSRVIDMVHYFMDLKKSGGGHMPRSTDPDRGQSAEGKKGDCLSGGAAGGTGSRRHFMEKEPYEAVIFENLVTSPAWPGNVEILKGFLKLLGVTIS